MLELVHFIVLEVVEAAVLCVTSHKRKCSFAQVIFKIAVAGFDLACSLSFKIA